MAGQAGSISLTNDLVNIGFTIGRLEFGRQVINRLDVIREVMTAIPWGVRAPLVLNLDITDQAIKDAAKAVGLSRRRRKKIPKFFVIESRTPEIYAFDTRVLSGRRDFHLLNYFGVKGGRAHRAKNNAWLNRHFGYKRQGAPKGYQLDEFPYASTLEGGSAGPAEGEMVDATENRRQGAILGLSIDGKWGGFREDFW